MENNTNKIAKISKEGFIELTYSENIDVINQNNVLRLGLEKANEAGLLDRGFSVLVDVSKVKTFTPPSSTLTNRVVSGLKINHVAVYGPEESIRIAKEMARGQPILESLRHYFLKREDAVSWLDKMNKEVLEKNHL
jgi:hypothetical protein